MINALPNPVNFDRLYLGKIGTNYMENSGVIGGGFKATKLDDTSLENITA